MEAGRAKKTAWMLRWYEGSWLYLYNVHHSTENTTRVLHWVAVTRLRKMPFLIQPSPIQQLIRYCVTHCTLLFSKCQKSGKTNKKKAQIVAIWSLTTSTIRYAKYVQIFSKYVHKCPKMSQNVKIFDNISKHEEIKQKIILSPRRTYWLLGPLGEAHGQKNQISLNKSIGGRILLII